MTVCLLHFNPVIVLIRISKENSVAGLSNTTSLIVLNHVLRPPKYWPWAFFAHVSGRVNQNVEVQNYYISANTTQLEITRLLWQKNMLEYNVNKLVKDNFCSLFQISFNRQSNSLCLGHQNMCSLILLQCNCHPRDTRFISF